MPVSLLFVMASGAFAAVVFGLTAWLMPGSDTTLTFVPANAITYVHASGRDASAVLMRTSPLFPKGVHPNEVAAFTAPGDGPAKWGAVLVWPRFLGPSAKERIVLEERGAMPLDERRWFVGDAELGTASKVAHAAHASLEEDAAIRDGLAFARSLFPLQMMTRPREAFLPVDSTDVPFVSSLAVTAPETTVAGVLLRDRGFVARMMPLSVASSADPDERRLVNGRDPAERDRTLTERNRDLGRIASTLAITEPTPSTDLASILGFSQSTEYGSSDASMHGLDTTTTLNVSMTAPYVLWVRSADPQAADDTVAQPDFLFRFPDMAPENAAAALARAIAAQNPSFQDLTLPDGETVQEMTASNASYETLPSGDLLAAGNGLSFIIAADGMGGSLISKNPELIADYRKNKAGNHATASHNRCLSGMTSLLTSNADQASALTGLFGNMTLDIPWKSLFIAEGENGTVFYCGQF